MLIVNNIKTSFAQQSIFATPSANRMKQSQSRHVFPRKLTRHCSSWFNYNICI